MIENITHLNEVRSHEKNQRICFQYDYGNFL
jgi:hypothetical protein